MFVRQKTIFQPLFFRAFHFVMWLHQRNNFPASTQPLQGHRHRKFLLRPRQIHHHNVNAALGDIGVQGIGALAHNHARIIAQSPRQRSVPRVNADHLTRARAQEHVGETANIAAKISANCVFDLHGKCV